MLSHFLGAWPGQAAASRHRCSDVLWPAGQFEHHGGNPLELDALLVDEASMLDIQLGLAMLRALPKHKFCQLVLVGELCIDSSDI